MAVTNQLSNLKKKLGLTAYLTQDVVRDQISKVVGGKDGQQFVTSIISAAQANPALQECTNPSILSAALLGQSLHLSPSPQLGYYYMVPFENRKNGTKEAQFILGYKGMMQLAIRSGYYKRINAIAIKEGELVRYDPLEEEIEVNLIEDEYEREQAPTVGYYAFFEYLNGFRKAIYWSKKRMEAHAERYSMGYKAKKGYTFWEKDFDSMAIKTLLRQLLGHYGIMSTDMQVAYEADQAVIREDGSKDYVDVIEAPQSDEKPAGEEITVESEKVAPEANNASTNDAQTALFS